MWGPLNSTPGPSPSISGSHRQGCNSTTHISLGLYSEVSHFSHGAPGPHHEGQPTRASKLVPPPSVARGLRPRPAPLDSACGFWRKSCSRPLGCPVPGCVYCREGWHALQQDSQRGQRNEWSCVCKAPSLWRPGAITWDEHCCSASRALQEMGVILGLKRPPAIQGLDCFSKRCDFVTHLMCPGCRQMQGPWTKRGTVALQRVGHHNQNPWPRVPQTVLLCGPQICFSTCTHSLPSQVNGLSKTTEKESLKNQSPFSPKILFIVALHLCFQLWI